MGREHVRGNERRPNGWSKEVRILALEEAREIGRDLILKRNNDHKMDYSLYHEKCGKLLEGFQQKSDMTPLAFFKVNSG